ncbi:serine:threonine protein phosphatase PGAM5 [Echinococcus multilocularis]|uniref:Serine/threonine-protein phosphatase PGAM5, mitochondrial n=1 Tax=Echinococcus multilocularis TaxID=6211 RepID=A0A068YGJ6_ECHMU|nr:serine:threonine protein phosphatase PGAM5 [Echinococcus multilocularis]
MPFPRLLRVGTFLLAASATSPLTFPWSRSNENSKSSLAVAPKLREQGDWNHNWDFDAAIPTSPPTQYRRLKLVILVRHGQYDTKAAAPEQKVLTELGWKQAIATGKRLRELGYHIDCIVHSDMIRARQTTAGILSELDQVHLSETGILEVATRPPTLTDHEVVTQCSPLVSKSCPLLESSLMAEGPPPVEPEPSPPSRTKRLESLCPAELSDRINTQNRIGSSFHHHIHRRPVSITGERAFRGGPTGGRPFEVVVFVGHANVFRYWICRALQIPPEAWLRISLPHGSITELLVDITPPSECTVTALRIGDDGHIPVELQSR